MKLSEMRRWLDERGIQLTKSLGQNFLHDGNVLQRIVNAAGIQPGERLLEIGPGLGPLTELLLSTGNEVLAIEMDERLVAVLRERFAGATNLRLVTNDALAWLRHHRPDWTGWKLVANLPYSVASPILVELAQAARPPERMTVTLQAEVARRLFASADDDDYGVLTLLVQLAFTPGEWFKIPASCFFPEPDVESACITLHRRPEPLLPPEAAALFPRVIKRAFSQRRKMMRKLLRAEWPETVLDAAFAQCRISPQTRAEALPLETFVELVRCLAPHSHERPTPG